MRVSVYYATGTVAVEYKESQEQWGFRPAAFHWGCSLEMLSRLLQVWIRMRRHRCNRPSRPGRSLRVSRQKRG